MEDSAPQNPGGTFPPAMLTDEDTQEIEVVEETTEEVITDEEITEEETKTTYQSAEAVAREVVQGRWGVGQARRTALKRAGYDPNEVQEEVKKILNRQ